MSEKRFVQVGDTSIKDTLTGEKYYAPCEDGLLDLLNEQQEHITHLEDTNDNFRIKLIEDIEAMEQAEKKIGEQQATIRKLQDLCGQSDYENAKLRLKNKELQEEIKLLKPTNIEQYEQIVQLQEENEQLRQQLKEKEEDERLYANEIVKLNKEAKEVLDFKSLGGDY